MSLQLRSDFRAVQTRVLSQDRSEIDFELWTTEFHCGTAEEKTFSLQLALGALENASEIILSIYSKDLVQISTALTYINNMLDPVFLFLSVGEKLEVKYLLETIFTSLSYPTRSGDSSDM